MRTFIETWCNTVKVKFRDYNGNIIVKEGDRISWKTIGGDWYVGDIVEMDSNMAYVKLKDGRIKTVEC